MVPIVQLVRTPDCGSGGRGFEPLWAPYKIKPTNPARLFPLKVDPLKMGFTF